MSDYISRQAAIDAVNNLSDIFVHNLRPMKYATDVQDAINGVPSADVQPVRQTAEWIYGEKDGADGWYCSKCGFHVPWYYEYYGLNNINFIKDFRTCPHCDAKMLKYTGMEREQNG